MKKRIYILFILFLCINDTVFSQVEELKQNSWCSVSYKSKLKKSFELNFDGGIRFCDHFIDRNRQNYLRVIFEKKVNEFNIGLGYAFFDTFNFSQKKFVSENRPFVQVRWEKQLKEKIQIFSRFRSEFRIYENQLVKVNRNRLQIGGEYQAKKLFNPKVTYELFYSNLKINYFEQRYSFGNAFNFSKLKLYFFYTFQLQQTVRVNNIQLKQNIVGVQIRF